MAIQFRRVLGRSALSCACICNRQTCKPFRFEIKNFEAREGLEAGIMARSLITTGIYNNTCARSLIEHVAVMADKSKLETKAIGLT